ncbi:BRCA2, oligonucleotide/oligosaccharide-binding 1 [Cynara cardunculus var. scolymus]|uniref:BRCA2, oligonucleotide/oligosaccharide-binding 1 n=1 Tax=Cynara cardunculus var. scolymus TaxID=59895 RepID=A0A103Y6B1_CYNCS|nr:BRCA2, oligonucleotide/oligosaccharide-binding 1 [Cynara cardunculus var. scolymus]
MSTWQVFSDTGSNFRWQCSHAKVSSESQKAPVEKPSSPHHLPSIADILVQGYSKLYENQSDEIETQPTFRNGLGKPVAVKQSSLAKASSILGYLDDGATADTGYSELEDKSKIVGTPFTFRTGLGKSIAIKQSSMAKALSMFGGQDNDAFLDTGCLKVSEDGNDKATTPLTYQTGSGKLVATRKSSLEKVSSILGDQDDVAISGGSVGRDDGNNCMNSMFQTGSGKAVNICSMGLIKARTLLGLEENSDHDETSKGLEQSREHANVGEFFMCPSSSSLPMTSAGTNFRFQDTKSVPVSKFKFQSGVYEGEIKEVAQRSVCSASRPPSIKFYTAGGRSVKVSGDALKRARSLLGDPDLGNFLKEGDAGSPVFSSDKNSNFGDNMLNKENNVCPFFSDGTQKAKNMSNNFVSPVRSTLSDKKTAIRLENIGLRSNLIKEFDAVEHDKTIKQCNDIPCSLVPLTANKSHAVEGVRGALVDNSTTLGVSSARKSLSGPLVDISNTIGLRSADNKQVTGEKRKVSSRKYTSPFKRPRNSKFIPPLDKKSTLVPNGTMPKTTDGSCRKRRVSTLYPFQFPRKYIKEYFGEPPSFENALENLPEWLRKINPENADKHMFEDESGLKCFGADSFFHMLASSGSSTLSKEWIANHYRWIVWKLACYERCYPAKSSGKLLTASNVLEELKYRYEREVNNGHRSALKRILEGDALPSSPLVLCIASIQLKRDAELDTEVISTSNAIDSSTVTSIELTDGWYSVKGLLDGLLLKQLVAGKLFVGQKLRICGAGLCGWNAPVSPLEASTMISLCLHINGTYRAHWADRLGFCKSGCIPLAFKCIKGSGGVVPSTLVGVIRIYPVLYKERLTDGGFVVRSERMESKRMQLYDQRRSSIVEGVMSEFQRGLKSFQIDDEQNTGDEGKKILQLLEKAAEPEVMMAEMSSEQLTSFATYQAKIEATRQSEMQKSIEKALEEAGLSSREVNTLMRVRVVGLTSKSYIQKSFPQQGLITLWNPTEKQQLELVEGQAYAVTGLTPINSDSDTIYLRARGSTTKWQPLSQSMSDQFLEFDVAAFVIYVGEVHTSAHQNRQWVFVADGTSISHPHELSDALLAISFCSPSVDCDSTVPINYNLVGSTVGFCNLIKSAKDQTNHIWLAEATENSTYFLSYDSTNSQHLKTAAASADQWAKASNLMIEKLKGKISSIVARKV